jgi:hypothetical protein
MPNKSRISCSCSCECKYDVQGHARNMYPSVMMKVETTFVTAHSRGTCRPAVTPYQLVESLGLVIDLDTSGATTSLHVCVCVCMYVSA